MAFHDVPAMIVDAATLKLRTGTGGVAPSTVAVDGIIGFYIIRQINLAIDGVHTQVMLRRPTTHPFDARHPRNLF